MLVYQRVPGMIVIWLFQVMAISGRAYKLRGSVAWVPKKGRRFGKGLWVANPKRVGWFGWVGWLVWFGLGLVVWVGFVGLGWVCLVHGNPSGPPPPQSYVSPKK